VSASKFLPSHPSFESIRKQAKKLVRQFAAGDPDALARVHANCRLPSFLYRCETPACARPKYGFAGWQDLRAAVIRLEGKSLEWAAAEAERAIHGNNVERLAQLIQGICAFYPGAAIPENPCSGLPLARLAIAAILTGSRCSRASNVPSFS